MWYILIKFDGNYVHGYVCPGYLTEKEAIQSIKDLLTKRVSYIENKEKQRHPELSNMIEARLDNSKACLKSFENPKTLAPDGELVLKISKIDKPLSASYWLKDIVTE